MKAPTVLLEGMTCIGCGVTPALLAWPVLIEKRGGRNVVEGICVKCDKPLRFLSTRDYPTAYRQPEDKQQTESIKEDYRLQYGELQLEFKNKRAYRTVRFLINKGKISLTKISEIMKKPHTIDEYKAMLDRKGLKGKYRVKGEWIIMRGDS